MKRIKAYYQLTKPGIIYGNMFTAIAGFFLGAQGIFHIGLWLAMAIGSSLGIASACVLNNIIDRDIDKHMERTKKRALVTGEISPRNAFIFGAILGVIGFAILFFFTNLITLIVGIIGGLVYLFPYAYAKRHSVHGTLVGAISGATPIVTGYTAASGHFDLAALLLFAILFIWQMPHFYAIAIFRLKEYAAAHIPVFPVKMGVPATKIAIVLYILLFLISVVLLTVFHYSGLVYVCTLGGVALVWLLLGLQ